MAKPARPYIRLTRNAAGLGSYASLWLSADHDHLMLVRSTGYTESYSRVQLSDIKAILLTPSDRRLWWGAVWGLLAVVSGVRLGLMLAGGQTPIFSAIFFGIGTAALLWNHWLGAGCRACVATGVQMAPLESLVRIKKARRVIARLQPFIAEAQVTLRAPAITPTTPNPNASASAPAAPPPIAG